MPSPLDSSMFQPQRDVTLPSPVQPTQAFPGRAIPGLNPQEDEFSLQKFLGMLQRRILVVVGVASLVLAFTVWSIVNEKPVYQGSFQLLVEPVNSKQDLSQIASSDKQESPDVDYDTQIAVLKSPELLAKPIHELQETYPGISYGTVAAGLQLIRPKDTKIIAVQYQSNDPGLTYAVLSKLSQTYLQYSLNEQQSYLKQGIQFVNKQIPPIQAKVTSLQDQIQKFRQQNGFLDPDAETQKITSQKAGLEQQHVGIRQDLVRSRSYFNGIQGQTGALATLNQSPGYQQLLGQVQQVDTNIATELTRFRPQNLNIQVLQQKKENLLPLLQQEATRSLDGKLAEAAVQIQLLEVQDQALTQAEAELQQRIQELPALTREYANLQQELQISSASLTRFLETRQNLQVQASQQEIPWQLIQAPTQPTTSSDITKSLVPGIIGSIVAGMAAAILLEKLDTTYHMADDLGKDTNLPVFGMIPFDSQLAAISQETAPRRRRRRRRSPIRRAASFVKSAFKSSRGLGSLSLLSDPYESASEFMESLRVLQTNFQMLSNAGRPVRSVVISSATPGDGKSTIALNWAKTAATMGQRVLLVDTDLRHPQIHAQLQLDNDLGFSDLISRNLKSTSAIQRVSPDEEFYVLTAGTLPPNPASLLASQKTKQFMEKTYQLFDLIIYDTPPLLGLADASLLARHANGLVLVVGLDKTDRSDVKKAIGSLKAYQVPVLGLVANGQRGSVSPRDYSLPAQSPAQPEMPEAFINRN